MSSTEHTLMPGNARLALVDSLRGLALMAIILLHCIEHYNCFYTPQWQPEWLNALDSAFASTVWMLFAGKAYATFSLLFGFSFYIQMRNARARGCDFRWRFAWRMLLLAGFAQLHALFYNGDILLLYAVCGLILIPASRLNNKALLAIALFLLLQPIDWGHIIVSAVDPSYVDLNNRFAAFASQAEQIAMHGNLWQTWADNITNGQLYSNFWQVEAGRITQTPALFMLGMWLGRKAYFVKSRASIRFWRKTAAYALVLWAVLYFVQPYVVALSSAETWVSHIGIALSMPANFCMMAVLVALMSLIWFSAGDGFRFQRFAIPIGRMSLTAYITQSLLGVTIFYNYGLGLYRYCGPILSAVIAAGIIAALWWTGRMWLRSHRQGPLERVWKSLTWIGSSATVEKSLNHCASK